MASHDSPARRRATARRSPSPRPHSARGGSRLDQRKQITRGSLIAAAQHLIAEGRSEVSIQEITDLADVGFGSFYNHFASKAELFHAATEATIDEHIARLHRLTAGLDDPAEVFAVSFRLTGRLQRVHPLAMRVLVRSAPTYLFASTGMAAEARRDIRAATVAGRFDAADGELDVALACAAGTMVALLQLLEGRPELDAAAVTDAAAVRVLRMLGLTRRQAVALASRPLPELPAGR